MVENLKFRVMKMDILLGLQLFDKVTKDMKIYKEEIFGPVLSVVRAKIMMKLLI